MRGGVGAAPSVLLLLEEPEGARKLRRAGPTPRCGGALAEAGAAWCGAAAGAVWRRMSWESAASALGDDRGDDLLRSLVTMRSRRETVRWERRVSGRCHSGSSPVLAARFGEPGTDMTVSRWSRRRHEPGGGALAARGWRLAARSSRAVRSMRGVSMRADHHRGDEVAASASSIDVGDES